MSTPGAVDAARYLRRIGVVADAVDEPDRDALAGLQRAHALAVPFENLSITGDPHGDRDGEGVSLALPDLFEKVVARRRGGFCYELNGLFGALLAELGFDVDRAAGMVLDDDGAARPPANHLVNLVTLDRPYVVDVGMGAPRPRDPVPLDGTVVTGEDGVDWQVVESDRPDVDGAVRLREPDDDWERRYVFSTTPRELSYFEATCDYLSTAPESPFTGDPFVVLSTPTGYRKLTADTYRRVRAGETTTRDVAPDEWQDLLESEFGFRTD